MKQELSTGNLLQLAVALAILAVILFASACATLPRSSPSVALSSQNVPNTDLGIKVNINAASPEALETLPGVGRGIAERIVTHRQQYGPFRRAEHLMMVRGISDRKFRQLRAMVVVE